MPLVAIAYLCPKKAHAEHAQDDGFGHIRLRAGDKLRWSDIRQRIAFSDDTPQRALDAHRPWFSCVVDFPIQSAAVPWHVTRFEVNRAHKKCRLGWHYSWTSSRKNKTQWHVVELAVLWVPAALCCDQCLLPLLSSCERGQLPRVCPHCCAVPVKKMKADENNDQQFTVCEVLESPAFQIFSSRRGPHDEAQALLTQQQKHALGLVGYKKRKFHEHNFEKHVALTAVECAAKRTRTCVANVPIASIPAQMSFSSAGQQTSLAATAAHCRVAGAYADSDAIERVVVASQHAAAIALTTASTSESFMQLDALNAAIRHHVCIELASISLSTQHIFCAQNSQH